MGNLPREHQYMFPERAIGVPEGKVNPLIISAIEKLVGIGKLNELLAEIGPPWPDANALIEFLFERLNINWEVENNDVLEALDDRPKVFVANHPYGLPDAFAMFQLLTTYRPRMKLFANKLLSASRLEDERLLYVDPFMNADSRNQNRKSMATALKHLRDGGDLALFPGRICSHLKTSDWLISDSEWTNQIRKFVEVSGGDMVPMFISGRNSMLFNVSGLIHPKIRTYMLLREFLRGGHDFRFRIGEPVSAEQLAKVARSIPAGAFSRSLTYALKTGSRAIPHIPQLIDPDLVPRENLRLINRAKTPIAGKPVKAMLDQHEVLVDRERFAIYSVERGIPDALLDIVCQVRFEAYAAETKITDPAGLRDRFDPVYSHLILWDKEAQSIVGVYRYFVPGPQSTPIDEKNLVTGTIFDLKPGFKQILPNAMELGRAAILPEYQKSFSPLMLLWRGILEVPAKNRDIKYLFGPVTMGRAFKPVSHELLRRYIMEHCNDEQMTAEVSPKRRLEFEIPREVDLDQIAGACTTFSQLSNIVRGFEGGKRELPVLFRHYANVGCRYAGFGEWKELDHATAGLTMLELKNISRTFVERYFGKPGAEQFLAGR